MSQDSAADRLAKQMRYARSLDPMEQADAERAVYYAAFDRTIATLPAEQAEQVDLHSSYIDKDDTWILRSGVGIVIATVRDPEAPPLPDSSGQEALKPTRSGESLREHDKRILRAVGRKMYSLHQVSDKAIKDLAEAFIALAERVKTLERNNAIDAEAIAILERLTEQVDAIEKRGFRFLGKYQAPSSYNRGDVVNYKNALWNCVQDAKTGERPNTASHKWTLMITGVQE